MKKLAILLFSLFSFLIAQSPFGVHLEPISIPQLGGLQSYSVGTSNGKWLIIGGRLDGLHRRQPWASFDAAGHNDQLFVIDPNTSQKWSASLGSLSIALQEQLRATNMEFHQEGDYLYIIGGYGYSDTDGDHKTFPNLTAVNVPETIDAIVNGTSFVSFFRQITDSRFAVTGGHLSKIYNTWYLIGGHRFDGRYNPMGGPSFVQTYTDAARMFTLSDDGTNLTISHLPEMNDAAAFHRRDLNVVPQVMPNGEEGLTIFSGVFQETADIPYLNATNIDSAGYHIHSSFSQYYNHYHCASLPLFSAKENEMHTVFFGGIAQYYDSAGVLVQDNEVPFVKTVARVSRAADGSMAEYKLPLEMPGYLGASAEFILDERMPVYANGVIKLDEMVGDSIHVGYIYGGINSSAKNIFWINNGTQSTAHAQIFKVYIVRNGATGLDDLNPQSRSAIRMQLSPNPNHGILHIMMEMAYTSDVQLTISSMNGAIIIDEKIPESSFKLGKNYLELNLAEARFGNVLFVTLRMTKDTITQKLIIHEE